MSHLIKLEKAMSKNDAALALVAVEPQAASETTRAAAPESTPPSPALEPDVVEVAELGYN